MGLIRFERVGQTAVWTLSRGVTNAISAQVLDELAAGLREVRADPAVRSLVLTSSSDKFFSIGLDISELFDLAQSDFALFYQAFTRVCLDLYTLPKPTVAAITGHAIAGGCILALCCDYRLLAEGRKLMGLNEIRLGVPLPYVADCVLRQVVGARNARDVADSGEFYGPEELLRMGMVDQVLPAEQVLPKAIGKASSLGALPGEAFAIIKRNRTAPIEAETLLHGAEQEQLFVECWYSEEARKRLREAVKKF